MKKTYLLLALSVIAVPLVAQQYYGPSSAEEENSLAERSVRRARLAAQIAEEQRQAKEDGIYRGKVFGAEQQTYTSSTLGEHAPAKTKYVYDTSLIRAIKMDDEDRVRTLIYANVDVNERNYANITPLTLAAEKGNLAIVKQLVEAKANVNTASPYGVTPLVAATSQGNADVVEYLLEHGANPGVKDETGKTPLLYASSFNNEKLIMTLAKASPEAVNAADNAGNTPLIYAAQKGNDRNVKALLDRNADPDYRNPNTGVSALSVAAAEGHEDVIRVLAKHKANLDLPDLQGRAPLAYAVETGKSNAVRTLLSAGANPNVQDLNGVTPLMRASAKGDVDSVASLVRSRDINLEQRDASGKTALIYAAYAPTTDTTAQLLKRGASINAADNAGNTPLLSALELKNEAVANYLIGQGADTARVNVNQVSALSLAQEHLPTSDATQKIAGETDRIYQQALQEEAARLAKVRELEAQLVQDETLVQQLRAQHKEDAQEFVSALQTKQEQFVEQVDLTPTVLQEEASTAQQMAAANAQALRDQVTAEKVALENSAKAAQAQQYSTTQNTASRAKNKGKKQTTVAQKKASGIIQDMPTLQPRLRSMADE